MRIIAGSLGGRLFDSPGTHRTHPMSDKARGALFNALGDLDGLSVLDAFAGTGALGFEAISRGARSVLAIDNDKTAQKTIIANIKTLKLSGKVHLVSATVNAWLGTTTETFDVILCDPPYDDLQLSSLEKLAERVGRGGLLALSWPGKMEPPALGNLELLRCKNYGDISLAFYRNPA